MMACALFFKCSQIYEFVFLSPKFLSLLYRQRIYSKSHACLSIVRKNKFNGNPTAWQIQNCKISSVLPKTESVDVSDIRKLNETEIINIVDSYMPFENSGMISLMALKCCTNFYTNFNKLKKIELGKKIYKNLKDNGKEITSDHFKVLLQCFADNNAILNLEILTDLASFNIPINNEVYHLILKCLCNHSQMEEAIQIVNKMKQNGLTLEESHYSELIYGYAMLKDWENVHGIIKSMKNVNANFENLTFFSLLKAFCKQKDFAMLKEYYDFAKKKNIKFSENQILQLVEILTVAQKWDMISEVFNWSESPLNYNKLNYFLMQLMEEQDVDTVLNLLKIIINQQWYSFDITKNFILKLMKKNTPVDQLISIAVQLMEENYSKYVLQHVLLATLSHGTLKECLKVISFIKKYNLPIRNHYFWPLIITAHNHKSEKGVISIFKLMKKYRMEFDLITSVNIILPRINISYITPYKLNNLLGWDIININYALFTYCLNIGDFVKASRILDVDPKPLTFCWKNQWLKSIGETIIKHKKIVGLENVLGHLKPSKIDYLLGAFAFKNIDPKLSPIFTNLLELLEFYKCKISHSCYETLLERLPDAFLTLYNRMLLRSMAESQILNLDWTHDKNVYLNNPNIIATLQKDLDDNKGNFKNLTTLIFKYYCRKKLWNKAFSFCNNLRNQRKDLGYLSTAFRVTEFKIFLHNKDLARSNQQFILFLNNENIKIPLNETLLFCALLAEKKMHNKSLEILKNWESRFFSNKSSSHGLYELMEAVSKENDVGLISIYLKTVSKFIKFNNFSFTPCIKSFIERDDLERALNMFEILAYNYKITPYLIQLICFAWEKNDSTAMERIQKASLSVLGENALLEEAIAFSFVGDIDKIKNVFKKSPLLLRKLNHKSQKLVISGNLKELLNLYYAVEHTSCATTLLNQIKDCLDGTTDYAGAENFLEIIKKKGTTLPKKILDQLHDFVDRKKFLLRHAG